MKFKELFENKNIKKGDYVSIDLNIVKKIKNESNYLNLVNKVIRNAEKNMPYVVSVNNDYIMIRTWELDLMGDVMVPIEAITKVKEYIN
jgi:hypothetical protein